MGIQEPEGIETCQQQETKACLEVEETQTEQMIPGETEMRWGKWTCALVKNSWRMPGSRRGIAAGGSIIKSLAPV